LPPAQGPPRAPRGAKKSQRQASRPAAAAKLAVSGGLHAVGFVREGRSGGHNHLFFLVLRACGLAGSAASGDRGKKFESCHLLLPAHLGRD